MKRVRKAIVMSVLLGAVIMNGFAGGSSALAADTGLQIKQFYYLDKELDRISLNTATKPDGTRDGHLSLLIDAGAGTEIKSITMKTADANGKDTNHGIWKTWKEASGDIGNMLAVVQDGKIVNTTFQPTLGSFKGVAQLELYASDNNGMKPGEYYYLEIATSDGIVKSAVTPYAENDLSYAPVVIREFGWVDLKSDQTGIAKFEADGTTDGHFKLKLNFTQPTEVLAVILRPTEENGKDAYKGIWRTNRAGTGWLLGMKQGETVVTPGFKKDVKEPVGKFRGNVAFDLYANNNGSIKDGQYFVIEVETKFGTVISKPVKFGDPNSIYVNDVVRNFKTIIMNIDSTAAFVDETKYTLDAAPFKQEGRTLVPIRFISEALGAKVGWNGAERKVTLEKDDVKIEIVIDRKEATVNGETVVLDAPAIIQNKITLLPVRFVSETMKMKVFFDNGEIVVTDAK
ncbi:copper amine oxidase N-terminal domain-containing protein [Cohnella faecalis]|uniref:Copper amine oxidase N-terminal domain-containing protein n=1 Tax=Cohnella faecalis TaxID=2315694 RepID=A0A398CMM1_9BACL|nr:copper amine oxidase N-terminal domain-containing protein [Cohnella faecalis]RIE02489.1 copper amine oxidase N-terminal domain-containing protein [Cohnella faecalis]